MLLFTSHFVTEHWTRKGWELRYYAIAGVNGHLRTNSGMLLFTEKILMRNLALVAKLITAIVHQNLNEQVVLNNLLWMEEIKLHLESIDETECCNVWISSFFSNIDDYSSFASALNTRTQYLEITFTYISSLICFWQMIPTHLICTSSSGHLRVPFASINRRLSLFVPCAIKFYYTAFSRK